LLRVVGQVVNGVCAAELLALTSSDGEPAWLLEIRNRVSIDIDDFRIAASGAVVPIWFKTLRTSGAIMAGVFTRRLPAAGRGPTSGSRG